MFQVLFEVNPKPGETETYLGYAKMLRPEVEAIDGFIDNIRYRSLTREGWLLALSAWHDEKAMVRWRVHAKHHAVQDKGRTDVFSDYHLRIGEITYDTLPPAGEALREQRFDETVAGHATTVTLIDASRPPDWVKSTGAEDIARWLGLDNSAAGLVAWDVFEAVLTPGEVILLLSWRNKAAAEAFDASLPERTKQHDLRRRRVRIVRDYGMYDRREAPQYYPQILRDAPGHAHATAKYKSTKHETATHETKETIMQGAAPNAPLHYYLYSVTEQRRVGGLFADEDKLWAFAQTNGMCDEEIDREDADPRPVLKPDYEIHESAASGERLSVKARRARA
jgi:heme-degrading monooxygenase HmoA